MENPLAAKATLIDAWKAHLQEGRAVLLAGQTAARAGTRVDGSHRPENRGERAAVTSQGYLAQGLAQRLEALDADLALLTRVGGGARATVAMGAVVGLEEGNGARRWVAVLPGGDATPLPYGDETCLVLSPRAPIVRRLLGLEEGDVAEVERGGVLEEWEIVSLV